MPSHWSFITFPHKFGKGGQKKPIAASVHVRAFHLRGHNEEWTSEVTGIPMYLNLQYQTLFWFWSLVYLYSNSNSVIQNVKAGKFLHFSRAQFCLFVSSFVCLVSGNANFIIYYWDRNTLMTSSWHNIIVYIT